MRPRPLIIALAATLLTLPVFADDAAKNAKIEEMFRITKLDKLQDQMMEQVKGALSNLFEQPGVPAEAKAARKELDDQVWSIISKRVSWDKMKGEYLKIYSENMTEQELDSIIAFYKTPGGVALLEKMPLLMRKGMEIGQAQMKDVGPEIQAAVEKFVQSHKGK